MGEKIKVGSKFVGEGEPCYIIAEMSANHAGDFERAIEIIHAAKDCGADCVKIQTYTPDTMTIHSDKDYFKIKEGTWKEQSLYSLYKKANTPWQWHKSLMQEAKKVGIDFLSTPFDKSSVDFLEGLGMSFYKIASFELTDLPLIEYIASKRKPIILSTGMGSFSEIKDAVEVIKKNKTDLCLLKCSSAYPAELEDMNLKTICHLKETFKVAVGLSDHSLGSVGAVTAVALGANIIEKHFCICRNIKNPDASFSMEPPEFKQMVKEIRSSEKAIGKVSYEISKGEKANQIFRRSIFVVKDIKEGDFFTEENTRVIRPAYGLEPKHYKDILGKRAVKKIERGTPLEWNMVN